MRLLVVEDYAPLRKSLRRGLTAAGHTVDLAEDGEEGLWLGRSNEYDVIVLDLMLPGIEGLEILRTLRSEGSSTTVLLLTARDEVSDRVQGLDAGADDYLVKPFAFEELLARIRALGRRGETRGSPALTVGELRLDPAAQRVWRAERELDLTAREYALLELFVRRSGEVLTRQEIHEALYDFHSEKRSNVVDVYVGYLRKKLCESGEERLIRTLRGRGYRLEAESS